MTHANLKIHSSFDVSMSRGLCICWEPGRRDRVSEFSVFKFRSVVVLFCCVRDVRGHTLKVTDGALVK